MKWGWLAVAAALVCVGGLAETRAQEETSAEVERLAPRALEQPLPYDPAGKRDPFRPFTLDLQPEQAPAGMLTPLQRYDLGELSVVGIVWATSPARAMVEDSAGVGFIITVGTLIGRNKGVIKSIQPDRIVVEERVLDFYGQEQLNEVVMELPKDTEAKQSGRGR